MRVAVTALLMFLMSCQSAWLQEAKETGRDGAVVGAFAVGGGAIAGPPGAAVGGLTGFLWVELIEEKEENKEREAKVFSVIENKIEEKEDELKAGFFGNLWKYCLLAAIGIIVFTFGTILWADKRNLKKTEKLIGDKENLNGRPSRTGDEDPDRASR